MRFLALGDSYSVGEAVDSSERWPERVAVMLRTRGLDLGVPQIIAQTGWTTDDLAAGIAAAAPAAPYDIVSLLIGVNNQYRGRSAEDYRAGFRSLLAHAIALAGARARRVIVVSIPDWGVTPFAEGRDRSGITAAIDRFNAIGREEADAAGARFADITPASRERSEGWVARDGLHPSGAQYERWAGVLLPVFSAAMREE